MVTQRMPNLVYIPVGDVQHDAVLVLWNWEYKEVLIWNTREEETILYTV